MTKREKVISSLDKVLPILIVLGLLSVVSVAYGNWLQDNRPPYRFLDPTPTPDSKTYCPGETVKYTVDTEVLRPNVRLSSVKSLFDIDRAATVLPDTEPRWLNWDADMPTKLHRLDMFTLPFNMEPGNYKVIGSLKAENIDPIFYSVHFRVPQTCFQ